MKFCSSPLCATFFLLCFSNACFGGEPAYGAKIQSSVVEGQALISVAQRTQGVFVLGFEAEDMYFLKTLSSSISDNALIEFKRGEGALVGAKLAQLLSLHQGDVFTLINPTGQSTFMGQTPLVIRYRILGVVDNSFLTMANDTIYITRTEAEKFLMPTR
ncbi:hypothetical protein RMS29_004170 [Agrobacterium rosae]|uniref:Uncharacterized protein n=1 Tax=Agrobacterium rosae TaxID=1972867 RepID=A0AAE5RXS7_9HYPH|nr:hypothetical protein [Agrobacterium rosae]KAA3514395.1 hypothetical protein DXM21_06285 [Agrobacterium rosae]KAA3523061.1 hypothetical protein DXM25_06295 [Agrobacterium rosae]MCM2433628.1 hypothetical protein [Agrobacterium rosae]MDX8329812.1 hypothetical protein [Agrobacterium rosae]MQB47774.1 hypothetical protein [Agrobacterium rosae]